MTDTISRSMREAEQGVGRLRYDQAAEQAVLGALMTPGGPFDEIVRVLRGPQDFYRETHRLIFEKLVSLREEGLAVDMVTVTASMDPETVRKVGGVTYLHDCVSAVPTAANGPHYAAKVKNLATMRELAAHGARVTQLVSSLAADDVDRAVEWAQKSLADISTAGPTSSLRRWGEVSVTTMGEIDRIEQLSRSRQLPGVPTGWADLDMLLNNLQPGQVIVIGGRPGTGKSNAGLNIAQHAAMRCGKRTVFFSLEMSEVECGLRLISAGATVPLQLLRSGKLNDADWTRVARFLGETAHAPLYLDESPNIGTAYVRSALRGLANTAGPPELVVFDYIQLGDAPGHRSRQEAVASLSRGFKLIGKEYGCPVVALSQLNRGPEQRTSKRPSMADLRESGAVEQDADVIILLHRDDYYDKESPRAGEVDFIVEKHRQGPTDTITLAAQLHFCRFVSMAMP